jgi:hypothetical protein
MPGGDWARSERQGGRGVTGPPLSATKVPDQRSRPGWVQAGKKKKPNRAERTHYILLPGQDQLSFIIAPGEELGTRAPLSITETSQPGS